MSVPSGGRNQAGKVRFWYCWIVQGLGYRHSGERKAEAEGGEGKKKNQFERNGDKSLVASEPTLKVTLAPLSTRPLLENQTAAASARWSGGGLYVQ